MSISRITTWIIWIENIVLAFIIAFTFYISIPITTQKKISIVSGDSVNKIITQLNKKGYNLTLLDKIIFTKLGTLHAGEVFFQETSLNRIDFFYALTHKAKISLLKITLIPGETKEIFFQNVAKKLEINATKLLNSYLKLAPFKEASIVPDTYFVSKKMSEKKLILFLLNASQKTYQKLFTWYKIEDNQTKQNKMLTIASIIQKEAGNIKEMPLVASVIYNRLKKNMPLQMDGTLNYGIYSHQKVTPQRIRNDKSLFNTYRHKGLPPTPIGSVSKEALTSAFSPASTSFLYFMRDKKGGHNFSRTFRGHRKNIKNIKSLN